MNTPPKLKLQYHQSNDSRGIVADDVRLSSRNTPGVSAGDVIEVYHPGDAQHGLFLISALCEDVQWRDTISIEQSLASIFKLQAHKNVCVQVVDKKSVTLDLVELCFRDQYFSRSDSYRFSQDLLGTVLQVHRKIEHNEMRVQVGELWRKGEVCSCGYVGPETKIVFRSATAVLQIFIQLSEEMWLFDEHGDLYFENALKFLSKLFLRAWPEGNCHHDVTVVFFTRVYITDVPLVYHNRANRDAEGRSFDDFYRVLVQNERLTTEEWKRVLTQLKLEFKTFQQELIDYLQFRYPMPEGSIAAYAHVSSAFDGNVMETLNMSLNLYAGYNVDRNFDRTGKSSIIISPGDGSLRVDSALLLLTKQRILDLGIGVDLVCLGQQPLHAVPLFEVSDWDTNKYIVPYWINCSFFRSGHQIRRINLGQPVNRARVIPSVKKIRRVLDSEVPPLCKLESAIHSESNSSSSTSVARRKLPVYRISYPKSTIDLTAPIKSTPLPNTRFLSERFTSPPEITGRRQSCADQNLFPSSNNHILTAITTASVVAKAARGTRRPSRCSESDASSINVLDWERDLEKSETGFHSSEHRGSLTIEKPLLKSNTQPMVVKGQNTRHSSTVASLPSVREHRSELMKSAQFTRTGFTQSTHRNMAQSTVRKKSFSSDMDGSISGSSSIDSLTTQGSVEFRAPRGNRRTRFSKTHSLGAQRTLCYIGSGYEQASKTQTLPNSRAQLTPSAPSHRKLSTNQPIRTGFRWSNAFGNGARVNSTVFPIPSSNNPFEAAGSACGPTGTTGKRRWVLVRPPDEFGNPIPPHRVLLSSRSWDFPNPTEAVQSYSEVWAAYFSFLRERLGYSAPGGPLTLVDYVDSRTIPGVSASENTRRSLQLATSNAESGTLSKVWASREDESVLRGPASIFDQTSSFGPGQWTSPLDSVQQGSIQEDPSHVYGGLLGQTDPIAGGSTLKRLMETIRTVHNSAHSSLFCHSSTAHAHPDTRGVMLTNVLRLIGTDWKSVSTPALLPIATDYFPDNASLKSEGYTLHDYRVVPVGVSAQEWESTHDFKREPGLSYCRRPMTVREVFYEMVLQRLGHGFQIYEECLLPSVPPVSATVGSPSSSLSVGVAGVSPPSLLRSPAAKATTPRSEQWPNRTYSGTGSLSRKHSTSYGQGRLGQRQRSTLHHPSSGTSTAVSQPAQCTTITMRTLGIGLTLSATGSSVRAPSKHLARPGRSSGRAPCLTQPLLDRLIPAHKTSFKLSIGHLFHSISLVDDSITLTNYRFRQEDPLRLEYAYALRVPDSPNYLPLRTVFTNDATNSLNWSYLDNYLCTRGVGDSYVLQPSLKYWRSRFMLLPIYSNETKRLQDIVKERMNTNSPRVVCDVYEDYRRMNQAKFCENFVHFIEAINRIRRTPSSARKPTRQSTTDKPEAAQRPRDLSSGSAGPTADASSAAGKNRCPSSGGAAVPGANVTFQRLLISLLTSASHSGANSDTTPSIGQPGAAEDQPASMTSVPGSTSSLGPGADLNPTGNVTPVRTPHLSLSTLWSSMKSSSTPPPCVVIMMADPENGLPFIQAVGTTAFPERTFMSFDAVVWTMKWLSDIETVEQAVAYLQSLLDAGWIRHASGNPTHAFIYGCYIYTLLLPDTKLLSPSFMDVANTSFPETAEMTVHSTPATPTPGLSGGVSQMSINTVGQPRLSDGGSQPITISQNSNNIIVQPTTFPEQFIPRATSGSTEWSADFQTDWAEVAFAHNCCSSSQSVTGSSTGIKHSTPVCTENHICPSSSCPDGFLTYTNISTLCGVTNKTGYQEAESILHKSCLCDFDDPTPEGRTEWAHFLYTANFHPHCAFTIELQWLVASGARLADLVNHWHNRAGISAFHFFPIPCHPFGHPGICPDADPLRCPLFIPLNVTPLLRYATEVLTHCASSTGTLEDHNTCSVLTNRDKDQCDCPAVDLAFKLFPGYPSDQQLHLLRSFQHYLLNRFGFIRDTYDAGQNAAAEIKNFAMPTTTRNWTYVHCSGGMFVMIPVYQTESTALSISSESTSINPMGSQTLMQVSLTPQSSEKFETVNQNMNTPFQASRANTTNHSEYHNACFVEQVNTGFFWSWNHMLPRRWRCYLTGDECFQDAMLADFRAFMNGEDDRLVHAFESFIRNSNNLPDDDPPNDSFKKQD